MRLTLGTRRHILPFLLLSIALDILVRDPVQSQVYPFTSECGVLALARLTSLDEFFFQARKDL